MRKTHVPAAQDEALIPRHVTFNSRKGIYDCRDEVVCRVINLRSACVSTFNKPLYHEKGSGEESVP